MHPRPLGTLPGILLAALLLAPAPRAGAESGLWHENDQSRVRLVTPYREMPASGEILLGLEFETEPGWHVYWKNSGDAGYPPAVSFEPTPQVSGAELLWPAPHRYELPGDLVAFGYEGQVIYPLRAQIDAAGMDGITLAADLDYLVCEVDCVPYSYRLTVDQLLAAPGGEAVPDPNHAPRIATWEERVPEAVASVPGVTTQGELDLGDPGRPALVVELRGVEPAGEAEPELFLEVNETFDAGRPEVVGGGDEPGDGTSTVRFRVPLAFRQAPETLPESADMAWTVTGLSPTGSAPRPMEARRTVPAVGAPDTDTATAGARPARPEPPPATASPAALALRAFLGGVVFLLTPTVLPLVLLRLPELAPADHGSGRSRRDALLTAAGVLAGSTALLPLARAARGAGLPAAWGAQLQEPTAVALLALGASLVALNLWGLLEAPLGSRRRGPVAGFALGVAVVALATAWNLPPLAGAVGPALAAGPGTALLVVLATGAGLALPFLAAAAVPRRIPGRALRVDDGDGGGATGSRLAEVLGFVEAGAALWLLYHLSPLITPEGLAYVEVTLLAVGLAAWARTAVRRRTWSAAWGVALLLLALAVPWLAHGHRRAAASGAGLATGVTDPVVTPVPAPTVRGAERTG